MMNLVSKTKSAAAAVALAVATLMLLQTQHGGDEPQDATHHATRRSPLPMTWQHGQRVPGRYLVSYHEPGSNDAHQRKRSHDDLVSGLAARGVQAEIVTRFDSSILYGAEVRMLDLDGADHLHERHLNDVYERHLNHLNELPHVEHVEAVRIITRNAGQEADWQAQQAVKLRGNSTELEEPFMDVDMDVDAMDIDAHTDADLDMGMDAMAMDAMDVDLDGSSSLHRRTDPPRFSLNTFHAASGADKAHQQGLNGTGTKIAIIDNGVEYTHPAFGNCKSDNFGQLGARPSNEECRISFGWDLVDDTYDPERQYMDPDPLAACGNQHGTAMAGMIVGKDSTVSYTGVATGATLGVYRMYDCLGNSDTSVLMRALAHAIETERVDVVLYPYPLSGQVSLLGARALEAAGRYSTVFLPAGHGGGIHPMFGAGQASSIKGVVTVTNAELTGTKAQFVVTAKYAERGAPVPSPIPTVSLWPTYSWEIARGWYEIVFADADPNRVCDETYVFPMLAGKQVLAVPDHACVHDNAVYQRMRQSGVTRVLYESLVYHALDQSRHKDHRMTYRSYISSAVTSAWRSQGKTMALLLLQDQRKVSAQVAVEAADHRYAPQIDFTSRIGPSPDLELLPTLAAPGSWMLTLAPVRNGSYTIAGGTDYAAAYAAGCAALLLQSRPTLSPGGLVQALAGTTRYVKSDLGMRPAPVPVQGAGLVQVDKAIANVLRSSQAHLPSVYTSKLSLRLGDATTHPATAFEFDVCNYNQEQLSIRFKMSNQVMPTLMVIDQSGVVTHRNRYGTSPGAEVLSYPRLVVQVDGAAYPPDGIDIALNTCSTVSLVVEDRNRDMNPTYPAVFSGFVVFDAEGLETRRVPYLGFVSRLSAIHQIESAGAMNWIPPATFDYDQNAVTCVPGTPFLSLRVKMSYPAARVIIFVIDIDDANSNTLPTFSFDLVPFKVLFERNSVSQYDIEERPITWDGTDTYGVPAPDGSKYSIITLLANYDETGRFAYSSWASAIFTVRHA